MQRGKAANRSLAGSKGVFPEFRFGLQGFKTDPRWAYTTVRFDSPLERISDSRWGEYS
jgi:hypothetical protein